MRTDILADAVGWRGSGGGRVAAGIAVGKALCSVDQARRPALHWRQTAIDTATDRHALQLEMPSFEVLPTALRPLTLTYDLDFQSQASYGRKGKGKR